MSRYPSLPPSEITDPQQRKVYDETSTTCEALFGPRFLYKDDDDAFYGPFAPLLYTPSLMQPYISIAVELSKLKQLPPTAREAAILATGSVFEADFELYAHVKLATVKGILSSHQTDALRNGKKPTGAHRLDDKAELAFDAAIALATGKGNLPDGMFHKLVGAFGRIGTLGLIHYVGVYAYTCILLNGVAATAPTE